MSETSSVQTVTRAFSLIELLCEKGECGITELSKASKLSKATVYRLLNTLCSLGYAAKNERTERYGITLKFLRVSAKQLSLHDMRHHLRPIIEQLSQDCGETVHLMERSGIDVVYIDKIEASGNSFRMASHIGFSLPMIYTAGGKAILSHLSDSEIDTIWNSSSITAKTPHTITDINRFHAEIEEIRKTGIAIDNEENETGVCCVSVAIPDINGEYRYAISVSAPAIRLTSEKIAEIKELIRSQVVK